MSLKDRFRRLAQMMHIIDQDHVAYLRSKALHFADDHRRLGYTVSNDDVSRILNTPDTFYCKGMTPLAFAAESFSNAQTALIAVRETIRDELGASLGRVPLSDLSKNTHQDFSPFEMNRGYKRCR